MINIQQSVYVKIRKWTESASNEEMSQVAVDGEQEYPLPIPPE